MSHPKLLNLEGSLSLAPSKINTYDEPSTLVWRSSRDLKLDPEVLLGGKEQNSCTLCTAWELSNSPVISCRLTRRASRCHIMSCKSAVLRHPSLKIGLRGKKHPVPPTTSKLDVINAQGMQMSPFCCIQPCITTAILHQNQNQI